MMQTPDLFVLCNRVMNGERAAALEQEFGLPQRWIERKCREAGWGGLRALRLGYIADMVVSDYLSETFTIKELCAKHKTDPSTVRLMLSQIGVSMPTRAEAMKTRYSAHKSARWKGGRGILNGYIVVHNGAGARRKREHRIIVEQAIGRPLLTTEVVHHINGDKTDNRLENLMVMTQSEHCLLHWKQRDFARGLAKPI